ncbi:unnamed protein product [Darwinula stevensoni]|uniref:Prolyl-tRNA synthetase n=1 Tax=Darwinula stevensoni TaxID=69355 RepID=A0A7R9A5B3_9CRUS|nr:unnamed protein product [Darwinula stevensoni]CAG0886078.1 unnamed protein product [Darwinula stevensoni]
MVLKSWIPQPFQPIYTTSKLFAPQIAAAIKSQSCETSTELIRSHKLLTEYGFISATANGMYAFLPLGMRVLEKLLRLVDGCMEKVFAHKISLPALCPQNLWEKTAQQSWIQQDEDLELREDVMPEIGSFFIIPFPTRKTKNHCLGREGNPRMQWTKRKFIFFLRLSGDLREVCPVML